MKELKGLNPAIPYSIRLKMAVMKRDYTEKARASLKHDIKYSVEAFNETHILRDPDKIGVTLFYPNTGGPTHIVCRVYPISIDQEIFGKQIRSLEKELRKKIPKELRGDKKLWA